MKDDLINFKKYYLDAERKISQDSFFHQSLNHKYCHSLDVLRFGQQVLCETPALASQNADFIKTAQRALLFHDVGRFEEAVRLYAVEQNKGDLAAAFKSQNHGIIGFDLLKNDTNYNDMRILFAVRWHGHMADDILDSEMYQSIRNSPQFEEITAILRLVRDADKLANLHVIKNQDHLRQDLFYHRLPVDVREQPISEAVKAQFFSGQVIVTATVHSFADRILQVISWIYDYNYPATKSIFNAHKFGDYLFQELAKYHHNPDDLAKISAAIAQKMQCEPFYPAK